MLTKSHEDWTKIEKLLLIANFWMCAGFFCSDFKIRSSGLKNLRVTACQSWHNSQLYFDNLV